MNKYEFYKEVTTPDHITEDAAVLLAAEAYESGLFKSNGRPLTKHQLKCMIQEDWTMPQYVKVSMEKNWTQDILPDDVRTAVKVAALRYQ